MYFALSYQLSVLSLDTITSTPRLRVRPEWPQTVSAELIILLNELNVILSSRVRREKVVSVLFILLLRQEVILCATIAVFKQS